MFKQLLKKTSIVLLALNFIACSLFTPAAAPSATDIEKEEQAIYSLFVSDSGVALLMEDTTTNISEDDPQQTVDYIKSGMKGISKETIDSYLARNAQPSQLSAEMDLDADYILLSRDELSAIMSQPDGWTAFYEAYPNSHGYTEVSRVGFNNSLDQAVIYVGNMAGPLMGAGFYYLMEKESSEWVIKEQVMVWIS